MTVWKSLLGAAVFVIGSTGQASALEPMIDSFHLTDLLESQQVKVLEVRSDEKAYLASHIPGSVYIPYDEASESTLSCIVPAKYCKQAFG